MVKNNFDFVHDVSVFPTLQIYVATFFSLFQERVKRLLMVMLIMSLTKFGILACALFISAIKSEEFVICDSHIDDSEDCCLLAR
jgi:hypothetical protein